MLKKTCTLMALAALGSMVFANVDLRTNIRDIYYRGDCEEAGSITMSVNGDDFFTASTSEPVYIRVRLDKGGKLCDTLVDFSGQDTFGGTHTNTPVYLAMRLEGSQSGTDTVAAPPGTISIVRWIGGENEMWMRVQTPTFQWISTGAGTIPPNLGLRVAWTYGVTARSSYNRNLTPWTGGQANLPYNTPDLFNFDATTGYAVSTLICVDVSTSILNALPQVDSELQFDTISFDDSTNVMSTVITSEFASQIVLGPQSTANFSGDDTIARGNDYPCALLDPIKPPSANALLCLIPGGQDGQDDGLVCMSNTIGIRVNCPQYGWNTFSTIVIVTPDDSDYGIPVDINSGTGEPFEFITGGGTVFWFTDFAIYADYDGVSTNSVAFTFPSETFSAGGEILSRHTQLQYNGPDIQGPRIDIDLTAVICAWYTIDPQSVVLEYAVFVTNIGDHLDSFPYDGTVDDGDENTGITDEDQRLHCPPSFIFIGQQTWNYGTFHECSGSPVVIFFPYLPKLVDTDFWAGVAVVNQGATDWKEGELLGRMYESDGSRWDVTYPPLARRNMQTYLVADGDQGVGFYDDENDVFLSVESATGDLVPLDTRFSMYVRGRNVGSTVGSVSGGDLDGFCLIGNTVTNVVYGYLPRNVQPGGGHIGDLPVVQFKDVNNTFSLNADSITLEGTKAFRRK